MAKTVKFLLLLLLACAVSFGQGSSTIYQTVFTNLATNNTQSSAIQNIGQSAHVLEAIFTNAPAHTCTQALANGANIRLEGGYDNVTWTPIGTPIGLVLTDGNSNLTGFTIVFGAFPYVRVNAVSFDNTDCRASVFYTGTLFPLSIASALTGSIANYQQLNLEITSASGQIQGPLGTSSRLVIYGLHILNAAAAAANFRITEQAGPGCSGAIIGALINAGVSSGNGLPSGGQITLPTSTVPYYTASVGKSICFSVTSASPVLDLEMVYRWE